MAIYNTVSVYQCYEFEKRELINLAKSFNDMRKKLEKESLSYEEFNSYYEKYFATVINNKLGFDYLTYGDALLKAEVQLNSAEEQTKFNDQKMALSKFLFSYVIEQELHTGINPKEVYSKVKTI